MRSLGEDTHVVPLLVPNLLQGSQPHKDEEENDDITICDDSGPSCHNASSTTCNTLI